MKIKKSKVYICFYALAAMQLFISFRMKEVMRSLQEYFGFQYLAQGAED